MRHPTLILIMIAILSVAVLSHPHFEGPMHKLKPEFHEHENKEHHEHEHSGESEDMLVFKAKKMTPQEKAEKKVEKELKKEEKEHKTPQPKPAKPSKQHTGEGDVETGFFTEETRDIVIEQPVGVQDLIEMMKKRHKKTAHHKAGHGGQGHGGEDDIFEVTEDEVLKKKKDDKKKKEQKKQKKQKQQKSKKQGGGGGGGGSQEQSDYELYSSFDSERQIVSPSEEERIQNLVEVMKKQHDKKKEAHKGGSGKGGKGGHGGNSGENDDLQSDSFEVEVLKKKSDKKDEKKDDKKDDKKDGHKEEKKGDKKKSGKKGKQSKGGKGGKQSGGKGGKQSGGKGGKGGKGGSSNEQSDFQLYSSFRSEDHFVSPSEEQRIHNLAAMIRNY